MYAVSVAHAGSSSYLTPIRQLRETGREDKACVMMRCLAAQHPLGASVAAELAAMLMQHALVVEAGEVIHRAIRSSPSHPRLYALRAGWLTARGADSTPTVAHPPRSDDGETSTVYRFLCLNARFS